MNSAEPKVDIVFKIMGKTMPVDHGYALYSAISRISPQIHQDDQIGIKLLRGRYIGDGLLDISPFTHLVIRLPVSRITQYIGLAGHHLKLPTSELIISTPQTKTLTPSAALYAHLVSTKNGHDCQRFENEITRQIRELACKAKFVIGKRRTFAIHGKQVVGYSLAVHELTAEESIAIQENGLGGRRKMGCGFFESQRK